MRKRPNQRKKTSLGVPDTDGRRHLERLLGQQTQEDIASACSMTQQTISSYVNRRSRPGPLARKRFEAIGIPSDAWFTARELKKLTGSEAAA